MAVNRPSKIGKYDVIEVIGRGGMGIVYKGRDPHLDRLVAIKMMTGSFFDNPDLLKRFYREAQSTASLQHRNIVTVYELGDQAGSPYLVMEYLDGDSLDSMLSDRRPLTLTEKLGLVLEVCHGLSYAHERGVVHRDIKPANIMVSKGGGVKIVDFGIAHFGDINVTLTGQIVGSISYMSPEQVNGRTIDARTDIFSTGIVLYQLLTSALPFDGDNAAATLLKIVNEAPPPLTHFLSDYPRELDQVIQRALAKDRTERYPSAEELALDLGQVQAQLRQNLIAGYFQQAREHIERQDLYGAKQQLVEILKIDYQNTDASLLLRELQEKIQAQEISKEVRQLRWQAEEAFGQERFETALTYIARALDLDKKNVELLALRDRVKTAVDKIQKLNRAISVAESAHQAGDLDSAKHAVDEALELAPNDTHVKALHRAVHTDWMERERRREIEGYVEQARREITSRKFTAALELLKQAEALAPGAPEIQALIETARGAQEQERRRRQLDSINRSIEDALNLDDYETASLKADDGLKLFPGERSLLKLKALAEKQRQAARRKQFIEQELFEARSLMNQGRSEEVAGRLEAALAQIGEEPRLRSLLLIVRENLRREQLEKRKAEYLQRAKEALRRKQHDLAINILEKGRAELEEPGEIEDMLQFAREDAANEERRRRADAAADQAHRLIAEQDYESAIRLLEKTLESVPDEELRIILGEARRAALDYEKKLELALAAASKLIEAHRPAEALQLLEAQPSSFLKRPEFGRLRETARSQAERLRQIGDAIGQARERAISEDYGEAIRILRLCRESYGSTAELEDELRQVLEKQVQAATRVVEKALNDARILLHAAEYQAAVDCLRTPSESWEVIPSALKLEWEKARQQAVNGLAQQAKAEIERQLAAGDITAAAELLERTLTRLPGNRDLFALETIVQQENARKADAETQLAEAQSLFQKSAWKPGAELLKRAFLSANRLPKVRQAVVETLVQGAQNAAESDWREAESLLVEAQELEPDLPRSAEISARISARRREEAVSECLEKAKRARQAGELRAAQSELAQGLSAYPGEPQLEELQRLIDAEVREQASREQREREQKEKAAFLLDLQQHIDEDPRLERRLAILKQALDRYPGDRALERQFAELEQLDEQVSALAEQAGKAEEAKQYLEAIAHWESIGKLYPPYPGLEAHLSTLRALEEEAEAAQKANWIQKIGHSLATGELEEAGRALLRAVEEFPQERQFTALKRQIEEARKLRTKAEKSIESAAKAFGQSRWKKGVESLCRAYETAPHDPSIRRTLIDRLSEAFQSALDTDWQSAAQLLASAGKLLPASSVLPSFERRVDERKRQELVENCLKQARSAQNQTDWQTSLRQVEAGLAQYPSQQELLALKEEIESRLRALEQERARQQELERERQLERARQAEERTRQASQVRAPRLDETRVIEEPGSRERRAYEQETQVNLLQKEKWPSADTIELPARPTLGRGTHPTVAPPSPEPTTAAEEQPLVEIVEAPARRVPMLKAGAVVAAVVLIALAFKFWPRSRPNTAISVAITTDPAGASVRVGDHACRTPGCQMELPPGNYRVNAQLDGYQPYVGTLNVEPDKSNQQPAVFVLQPLPPPPAKSSSPGILTVRAGIAGALVFIDEVARGRTGQDGVLTLQLEPKSYRVRVEKPNYQSTREHRVNIVKGASRDLVFDLVPVRPETPQSAQFELRGAPQDVEVRLAGTLLGRTDGGSSFRKTVTPGEQILQVTRGSATRQIKENLVAGQTLSLEWANVAPAEPTKPEPTAAMIEDQDWERVRASNQPPDIEAFLKKYPAGTHVPDAQLRLDELTWAQTNRNDLASLENYLARFPAGRNRVEASARIDDIQWSQVDKKDRSALATFLGQHPNSMHRLDAQRALEQIAAEESQKQVLLKPLDLFNAAFERQQPRELKEVWPSATDTYLKVLRPPAGYKVVLRLQASAEPVVSGSTAQVLCDLFSDTTEPGRQNRQSRKRVRVSLYKDGNRWLIRDPFGQE